MSKFLMSLVIVIFAIKGHCQDSLLSQYFLDGKLEILVPSSFHKMTTEEFLYKYPKRNQKVSVILTDSTLEANLLINHMVEYDMSDDSVYKFKDIQLKKIKNKFPTAIFLEDNTRVMHGKNVAFLKVITPADDTPVFNYFFITNLQGKVLLLAFNCIETKRNVWETIGDQIFSSLKLIE